MYEDKVRSVALALLKVQRPELDLTVLETDESHSGVWAYARMKAEEFLAMQEASANPSGMMADRKAPEVKTPAPPAPAPSRA